MLLPLTINQTVYGEDFNDVTAYAELGVQEKPPTHSRAGLATYSAWKRSQHGSETSVVNHGVASDA